TLEVYRDAVHEYNNPSFVTGRPFLFSGDDELKNARSDTVESEGFVVSFASGGWRWWSASSFVIRRDAFTAAGGFNDEWGNGGDVDLTLRLCVPHGFVDITAPVTFAYRNHAASLKHDVGRMYASARLMVRAERKGK